MTIRDQVRDLLDDDSFEEQKSGSREIGTLQNKLNKLIEERDYIKSERDKMNSETKNLFNKANDLRSKRDKLNNEVQKFKKLRNEKNEEIDNTDDQKKKAELKKKADEYHEKVQKIAEESQIIHKKMVIALKNAKGQKSIASSYHHRMRKLNRRIGNIKNQMKQLEN